MQPAILLVGSAHPGWAGLHASLKEDRRLRVVGAPRLPDDAARLAAERHPDAILVAADPTDTPVVALVDTLRVAYRAGKVIVIGPDEALDGDLLADLYDQKVSACLAWEELRLEAVHHVVLTVVDGGLLVASGLVMERLVVALERRQAVYAASQAYVSRATIDPFIKLSERELTVTKLRAAGLPYAEIAKQLFIVESTVKSHAANVKVKAGLDLREDIGAAYRRLARLAEDDAASPDVDKPAPKV